MVKDNLWKVKKIIAAACAKANRDPDAVTIIAVSKGRTPEQIGQAIEAGINDIGENKIQEAMIKYNALRPMRYDLRPVKWHMVGHLQTNKAKNAVKIFDLIQSVDSLHLALEIDKEANKINKIQDVLIQVNTSGETTKFGLKPDDALRVIKAIAQLRNINMAGLMTIAPLADSPEKARPYFRRLRELRDKINTLRVTRHELVFLSMGMTDDFETAIEEGADIVRLGRAIFQ